MGRGEARTYVLCTALCRLECPGSRLSTSLWFWTAGIRERNQLYDVLGLLVKARLAGHGTPYWFSRLPASALLT